MIRSQNKNHVMKNKIMKNKSMMKRLLLGATLAAVFVLATPYTAQAQEKGSAKGGASLLLTPIKTTHDSEPLHPCDAVVMSCPKCKTTTVNYVETTKGHLKEEKVKQQHLCPGCE